MFQILIRVELATFPTKPVSLKLMHCSREVQMPLANQQVAHLQVLWLLHLPPQEASEVFTITHGRPEAEQRVGRAHPLKARHRHVSTLMHMVPLMDLGNVDPATWIASQTYIFVCLG